MIYTVTVFDICLLCKWGKLLVHERRNSSQISDYAFLLIKKNLALLEPTDFVDKLGVWDIRVIYAYGSP